MLSSTNSTNEDWLQLLNFDGHFFGLLALHVFVNKIDTFYCWHITNFDYIIFSGLLGLDVLVNSAGILMSGSVEKLDIADYDKVSSSENNYRSKDWITQKCIVF